MKCLQEMLLRFLIWGICFLHLIKTSEEATIGDGTKSLYTGELINAEDTRGSCLVDGVRYMSETAIPRDHPCHYCICFQSQVTCYWKQCAAPPTNCDVMQFENVCNPSLYICDIPQKTRKEPVVEFGARLNAPRLKKKLLRRRKISRRPGVALNRARRNSKSLKMPIEEGFPVEFQKAWDSYVWGNNVRRRRKRAIRSEGRQDEDNSCTILGVGYELGDVIGVASDVCMECRCAADTMFCSPKCCFLPSPFAVGPSGSNSVFVSGRTRTAMRAPHPLHYVRNQYEEGQFLR